MTPLRQHLELSIKEADALRAENAALKARVEELEQWRSLHSIENGCNSRTAEHLGARAEKAEARVAKLEAMLTRLQFSHGPGGISKPPSGKCPVCLGWDGSPKGLGETRMRHAKGCELAELLSA